MTAATSIENLEHTDLQTQTQYFRDIVKRRSDKLMNYFLIGFFIFGLLLAGYYDTWGIAIGVGGHFTHCLLFGQSTPAELRPLPIRAQRRAGPLHGHSIFTSSTAFLKCTFLRLSVAPSLSPTRTGKLQLPLLAFIILHHAVFNYLQFSGEAAVFFTRLDYIDLQTFIIHILLAAVIVFICGLWAYQLKKYGEIQISQSVRMASLQREATVLTERKRNCRRIGSRLAQRGKKQEKKRNVPTGQKAFSWPP